MAPATGALRKRVTSAIARRAGSARNELLSGRAGLSDGPSAATYLVSASRSADGRYRRPAWAHSSSPFSAEAGGSFLAGSLRKHENMARLVTR